MTDLRIIPADPRDAARDTYRRFACEDRPGDPWATPFDPRRMPVNLIRVTAALLAGCTVIAALWLCL